MESNDIQLESKRGGARKGAGRPKRDSEQVTRWMAARGVEPLHAAMVLAQVGDERRLWARVLNSEDDRVVLAALTFLVSMRDGRPAQQINVTSVGVTISADEVSKARAIARELMGRRTPGEDMENNRLPTIDAVPVSDSEMPSAGDGASETTGSDSSLCTE